jgi:hypothetical protein
VTGKNHHVEIYAQVGRDGHDKKWDGEVVSMFEAYERLKEGTPVVQKVHKAEVEFRFSLARGEVLECDDVNGGRRLLVVQKISRFSTGWIEIGLADIRDARKDKELLRPGPNVLRQWHTRKVAVSPLGEVSEAHD